MGQSLDSFFETSADEIYLQLLNFILGYCCKNVQSLTHSLLYCVKVNLPALGEINFASKLINQLLFFIRHKI